MSLLGVIKLLIPLLLWFFFSLFFLAVIVKLLPFNDFHFALEARNSGEIYFKGLVNTDSDS